MVTPAAGVATRTRLAKIVFIATFAFTVLTITRPVDSNANLWARLSLTYSIVDRGALNIDPYLAMAGTPDWSYSEGHYYSNKAPGPALMAVPFYAAQRMVQRVLGIEAGTMPSYRVAAWIANLFVGVLPTLVALLLLWKLFEQRYGFSAVGAFGMTALAGVGSLSLPYTTFLFGHQTAAAFLTIALCLTLLEGTTRRVPRAPAIFFAGLAAGLAVLSDHMAAIGVLAWSVWLGLTWRDQPRAWAWWVAGGAGPALVLLLFNAAAFGSPLVGSYSGSVLNPAFAEAVKWHPPSLDKLLELTVGFYRGWFYATPVFACVIVGMVFAGRQFRSWPELLVAAGVVLTALLLLASWNSWHGGAAVGPRYLLWTMPFAMLLLVPVARWIPKPMVVLGQITAVLMLAVTVTDPMIEMGWPADPFARTALPALQGIRSIPTSTIWSFLGASVLVSFLLYLAIWLVAGLWIKRRLEIGAPRPSGVRP